MWRNVRSWLVAGLVLLAVGRASAAERVANGDFARLAPDGTTPAQWSYIAPDDGAGSLGVDRGPDGAPAAKIVCTRAEGRWGPGIGQVGVVEVKKGQWYELSFWARLQGVKAGVIVGLRDMTNWNDNQLWQTVYPGASWRKVSLRFQAHSDLAAAVSRLQFSFDTPGTVWLARVSLRETEKPRTPNRIDLGHVKNRVPNSSFEVGAYGWGTYGSTFLVGGIDATTARHGQSSFRLDLSPDGLPVEWNDFTYTLRGKPSHAPQRGLSLATDGYLAATPGQPMCLSAWVKADHPGGQVRLALVEDTGAERGDLVEVGTDWSRGVVGVTPESDTAFVRIALEPGAGPTPPAVLWVDAVQLEAGSQVTDYAPALPVEVGFETGRLGNVYHIGEVPEAKLLSFNALDRHEAPLLDLIVEGADHELIAWDRRILDTAPGASSSMVNLGAGTPPKRRPVTEGGFFRVRATWTAAAGPQERSFRFAVLQPLRELYRGKDTFLGQNHAFVDDGLMTLTQDAGTSWVRSWFVRWDDIEPEPGRFDFREADAQLAWLEKLGFHVQFCLGDPSSEWASTAPAELKESTGDEAESRRVWWQPKDMQAYENYVAALIARYGDRVKQYEVLNEPVNVKGGRDGNLDLDHSYLGFVQAARRAAERSGKKVEVMGAGLDYLKGVPDLLPILSTIDLLSEHRYPGLETGEGFQAGLRAAVSRMQGLGAPRPMWITEYGLYADDDPDPTTLSSPFLIHAGDDSELLAASFATEHQVVARANGADKVFFHIGNWPIILNREHSCGFHPFFEWNGLPRKMLVSENMLSWALPPGAKLTRAISSAPPLMAYEFTHERGTTTVAWGSQNLELQPGEREALTGKDVEVHRLFGERARVLGQITDTPLYFLTKDHEAAERIARTLAAVKARQAAANG